MHEVFVKINSCEKLNVCENNQGDGWVDINNFSGRKCTVGRC